MEVITRVIMVGAVIIAVAVGELTRSQEMNIAICTFMLQQYLCQNIKWAFPFYKQAPPIEEHIVK